MFFQPHRSIVRVLFGLILLFSPLPLFAQAPLGQFTILYTNDLHSHFRSDQTILKRGGLARLKTAIDRERRADPNTILVDGGDWSEGGVYYVDGAGSESLRMMDALGYDVAVIGNHDWLNGPDTLLNAIISANPKVTLLSANLDVSSYARSEEFSNRVLPYTIRSINGVKIGIIGLSTYEFIYDGYFKPVEIKPQYSITENLARQLKAQGVDAVLAVSHDTVEVNSEILKYAKDLDMIVGAHDHRLLTEPVFVPRDGAEMGWIVEAGCFGHFLGKLHLQVVAPTGANSNRLRIINSQMVQIDKTIPENRSILEKIDGLEALLDAQLGGIFEQEAGRTQVDFDHEGYESPVVDLAADSYRAVTGADIALEQDRFVYSDLFAGNLRAVDFFNTDPAIYNFQTGKTWTVQKLPISGRILDRIFNLIYSWGPIREFASLDPSGLDISLKPLQTPDDADSSDDFARTFTERFPGAPMVTSPDQETDRSLLPIQKLEVNGKPLDPDQTYTVAFSGGVLTALDMLHDVNPYLIPLDQIQDTGVDGWRAIADYFQALTPVTPDKMIPAGRTHSVTADVGILPEQLRYAPSTGRLNALIENFGSHASGEGTLLAHLYTNRNGANFALTPNWMELGAPIAVPPLAPGQKLWLEWDSAALVPDRGAYVSKIQLTSSAQDTSYSRSAVTHLFPQ